MTNADPKDVDKQRRKGKAFTYKFPLDSSFDKLDLILANEDDASGTMESCVNYIINRQGDFWNVSTWDTLKEVIKSYANKQATGKQNEILPASWKKFLRIINKVIDPNGIFNDNLADSETDLSLEIKNNLVGGQVMVVDMTLLDDLTQSFVFGSVAKAVWEMKFDTERDNVPKKVIIFVDELNKKLFKFD